MASVGAYEKAVVQPGLAAFAGFLCLQGLVLIVATWLPGSALWAGCLGVAGCLYVVACVVWPWLVVPTLFATTALDITGRVIKETVIGIPVTGFHLALLLMVFALAANAFLRRRLHFPRFELAVPLAAFLMAVGISLTWSPNQPEATISFVRLVVLTGFLYLVQVMIDGRAAVAMTVAAMAVAVLGGAAVGLVQIATAEFYLPASFVIAVGANAPRATGTFHNPNTFGTFMMVGLVYLTGVLVLCPLKRYQRVLIGGAALVGAAGLAVTFSRSNWLAALVGVGIILAAAGRLRHLIIAGVFSLVALLAVKEFVPFADHIFTRFVSIITFFQDFESVGRVSGSARVHFVQAALGMFLDNPLLGAGWRAFPVILDGYKPAGFPHWIPTRESHTLLATVIAELGVVGSIAAGSIVWVTLKRGIEARRATADLFIRGTLTSAVAVFVSFQVSLSFTADYGNNYLWFFTGLLFALVRMAERGAPAAVAGDSS